MDKTEVLRDNNELLSLFNNLQLLYDRMGDAFILELGRLTPFADLIVDRWAKAKKLGFGENTNVYDSSLIIGDVVVGKECWIGPNTILDGSGRLSIGNFCTISSGVQIYTHDNIRQTLSSKKLPIERSEVIIGNNIYIAPNVVVAKGVTIGDFAVVGTGTFVNKSIPPNAIVVGQPAKQIGVTIISDNGEINFKYQ